MKEQLKELVRRNPYIHLLWYMPVYLIAFFTIDRLGSGAEHHIIVCAADDLIPFNEYFVIPYSIWFVWFTGMLAFFAFPALAGDRNARRDFIKLCIVMFTSMTISLITYLVWPNGVDLRESIQGKNICAELVRMIRLADTPYGVCPSIHVGTITAEALVVHDSRMKLLTKRRKAGIYFMTLLIAYSTMAIKQHSIVDVLAGAALAGILYRSYPFVKKRFLDKFEIFNETQADKGNE